jgi:hypothetical protein
MKHNIKSVRESYQSLEDLQYYDSLYSIASRLGFNSCQEAWEANPRYWIDNRNNLIIVKPRKKHVLPKVDCSRGAPMGMRNIIDVNFPKLYLIKLPWIDGDYTPNGIYWGNTGRDNIYYAYNEYNRIYIRASSRIEAKNEVRKLMSSARFYN